MMNTSEEDICERRFGQHGGQYAPEGLFGYLTELKAAFERESASPSFWDEFRSHYDYIGRPTHIHLAERLTAHAGGAKIWFLREDLNHTSSYKIMNALGQILLARRMGKVKVITETGAGQHGVATAALCAKFGMECVVYIGARDQDRQFSNVRKMAMLGARVVVVESGGRTLRDAVNEAIRACVAGDEKTFYLASAPIGPYPIPLVARTFLSVIGKEAKRRAMAEIGRLPRAIITCVGAGANAIGIFSSFLGDPAVRLVGVEAAGDGLDTGRHGAALSRGTKGVFHGGMTYVLQDGHGQIATSHSVAAGLDYPGVSPELSSWKDHGHVEITSATDEQAMESFRLTCRLEGVIPALESAHAIHEAVNLAMSMPATDDVLVCISGNGDKDAHRVEFQSW